MNLEETIELLEALRAAGATHFKSDDFEVTLGFGDRVDPMPACNSLPVEAAPSVENVEATQKIQNLIDTLRLKDEDVLNKVFPDGAGG